MTLARVYVNYESTRMYERLFQRLFALVKERTGREAQWVHLHNRGFKVIVTDMDSKQVAGENQFQIH
jgi:hypothetical protein